MSFPDIKFDEEQTVAMCSIVVLFYSSTALRNCVLAIDSDKMGKT